jgi:hypothetical protein
MCHLADWVTVEHSWSCHAQVPWVLQNSFAWSCHVFHGLCSCIPLWLFLLVLSQLPMVSVGRCVYAMHVMCVCVCGFCIMPYVQFHIHLTVVTWNLIQARTLHLRSYRTDVNNLMHFMRNSIIIITLFFHIIKSCTLIWENFPFFQSPKSLSLQICATDSFFWFIQCDTFYCTIHWKR